MLKRSAYSKMAEWKEVGGHRALLVTGARQVGKTTLVRAFGRERYRVFAEINFLEQPDAITVISQAKSADDLIMRITALSNTELIAGETLVFFDEVQEFGDILTWAKFLVEKSEFDYIFSGSLLGVDLFSIRSWPVGFMSTLAMFPLDFEEFCIAMGTPQSLLDQARECLEDKRSVPEFLHEKLLDLHAQYLFVGGLPDAVQQFANTRDTVALRRVHEDLFALYEYDITKHMRDNEGIRFTKALYEQIPGQLNKVNKRFKLAELGRDGSIHKGDLRFSRMESSFSWLASAGVALPTVRISEPRFPLMLAEEKGSFKLYLNDVGLLMSRLSGGATLDILAGRRDINFGAPYENYVAQELLCHGHSLYYYHDTKRGEVDFVLQDNSLGEVTLVEVKSGKDYKRHRAMNNLLSDSAYQIDNAIVLCNGNVEKVGKAQYLPIYMAGWL